MLKKRPFLTLKIILLFLAALCCQIYSQPYYTRLLEADRYYLLHNSPDINYIGIDSLSLKESMLRRTRAGSSALGPDRVASSGNRGYTVVEIRDSAQESLRREYYNPDGNLSHVEIKIKKSAIWIELIRKEEIETSEEDFYWDIKLDGERIGSIGMQIRDSSLYLISIGLDEAQRGQGIATEVISYAADHLRSKREYSIDRIYTYTHRPAIFDIFMGLSIDDSIGIKLESSSMIFGRDDIDSILDYIQSEETIKLSIVSGEKESFILIERGKIKDSDIELLNGVEFYSRDFRVSREEDSNRWLLSYQNQPLGIIDSIANIIKIISELP
jgi:ribosomal protein S18 acetylase RimI-like enzyme